MQVGFIESFLVSGYVLGGVLLESEEYAQNLANETTLKVSMRRVQTLKSLLIFLHPFWHTANIRKVRKEVWLDYA